VSVPRRAQPMPIEAMPRQLASAAPLSEEVLEHCATFGFGDTADHLDAMIQSGITHHIP